jgi:hypothetical protein
MRQKKNYEEQQKDDAYVELIGEYDDTDEEEMVREDE